MITIVDNKYDIWFWVSKVIASCENIDHINSSERLIENFRRMFDDPQLTSKLQAELTFKIHELVIKKHEKK